MFAESLTEHMLQNGASIREFADAYVETRARLGLPPVPVETIVYARAVEIVAERMRRVDLLTGRDVTAAVRATKAMVRREERQQQFERLIRTVVTHAHRNSARFRVDAEIDYLARTHRGKPRVPVESLVVQLAMQEVFGRVPTNRLTIDDARSVARVAKQRVAMSFQARADAVDERIHRPSVG
ncbi:hypothetical protein [Cryobacterium sp. TMS1-13-1]|uniref:hypothetical protein n=1 Tax=Cryobacterium sp. TMS1-13-1 TaxID=1259220 RepID=UPI00106B1678|nr:hypothetical protein [Cryobacterium sp. TMS1-13-1]TFD21118.1 hypothetical protein E3T31_09600 [Cryobacterium sp. TMS1-13-1]